MVCTKEMQDEKQCILLVYANKMKYKMREVWQVKPNGDDETKR